MVNEIRKILVTLFPFYRMKISPKLSSNQEMEIKKISKKYGLMGEDRIEMEYQMRTGRDLMEDTFIGTFCSAGLFLLILVPTIFIFF